MKSRSATPWARIVVTSVSQSATLNGRAFDRNWLKHEYVRTVRGWCSTWVHRRGRNIDLLIFSPESVDKK